MRAVVTGGAGFIGSHLIEALVARGWEVSCVERPGAGRGWLDGLPIPVAEAGLTDGGVLTRLLEGADVVFHLAGLTQARTLDEYAAANAEGTACVLRAAAALGRAAPRVLVASSLAAQGPCRNGVLLSPDATPRPVSPYGTSKLLAEAAVHAHADRVPAVILRFSSVYGPRERGVLTMFRLVSRGLALTIGEWDRALSMLFVGDAVAWLIAAATSPAAPGRIYCLAHPQPVTWREFALETGRAVGRRPVLVSVPLAVAGAIAAASELGAGLRGRAALLNRERVREIAHARWVCDPSRAIADLCFAPRVSLRQGVAETARWYRQAGWL